MIFKPLFLNRAFLIDISLHDRYSDDIVVMLCSYPSASLSLTQMTGRCVRLMDLERNEWVEITLKVVPIQLKINRQSNTGGQSIVFSYADDRTFTIDDRYPDFHVLWRQALDYCRDQGRGGRLPVKSRSFHRGRIMDADLVQSCGVSDEIASKQNEQICKQGNDDQIRGLLVTEVPADMVEELRELFEPFDRMLAAGRIVIVS